MIVMSRARGEAIQIGDDILVTVVDIRGDKVRLGIDHPPNVTVHRREVYDAIQRNLRQLPPTPTPTSIQPPHFASAQPDPLGRFAAILEVKLGTPVTRDLITQALHDAGLQLTATQHATT
jgi:carbon storage regulator